MTTEPPATDPDRDPVDVLADEFATRYRRGETPSITEYVRRYPEHAEQIQSLFPSVALLEQLGSRPEGDGRPPRQGSLPPHHQIGDFEVLREIGRGGMGVVYEAVQQSLHRPVALKVLNTAALHSENQVKRFEREAQAAAQLHHTNIVPVFGVGEQDGLRYYVMQRIHGLGLDAVLTELSARSGSRSATAAPLEQSSDRSVSAHALAGVLISGELSKSNSSMPSLSRTPSPASAPPSPLPASGSPPEAEAFDNEWGTTRLSDSTPSAGETERGAAGAPVPSSLVLRDDDAQGGGVRSSLILRDEVAGVLGSRDGQDTNSDPRSGSERNSGERTHSFGRRYWRNIARVGMQVAAGLQYAHSQGTLHRDIKPANILLDTDGTAWIADFGLAKVLEADNVTHTGDVVGTLRYMAPEQFQGEANARSDIYSLGLTLYELLTLRPAYDETDRQKLIARKLTPHEPPSLRKRAGDIPRDLETIVHKCLAYESEHRYVSAGALLADLQAFVEDRPIQARQSTPVERLWRWCRRNPAVAGLSGTVAFLLVLTAGLTSAGYVQQKERALEERMLRTDAEKAQQQAVAESQKAERIAHIAFQSFDNIGQSFVSNDVIGTIELDDDDSEEQFQVPAYSPETAAIMEQLLSSFDELAEVAGDDQRFLDYAAKAALRAGELHLRLNQYDQARAAFTRAIGLHEQFEEEPQDPETRLRLAKLYNGLGIAIVSWRDREEKREARQRALELLSGDHSRPEMQFELARTHYLMGHRSFTPGAGDGPPPRKERRGSPPTDRKRSSPLSRKAGPPDGPEGERRRSHDDDTPRRRQRRFKWDRREKRDREHLEQATNLFADLVEKHPMVPHYQYWLALCYLETAEESRHSPEAAAGRVRAIAILEVLHEQDPDKADYLYQLSEAHELSHAQFRPPPSGRFPWWVDVEASDRWSPQAAARVERDLRKALQYSDELIERQPHVPGYAMSNLMLLMRLVDVSKAQEQYQQATTFLDRADESLSTIGRRFSEMEKFAQHFGTVVEFMRARLLVAEGRYDEAKGILAPMVDRFKKFEHAPPVFRGRSRHRPREIIPAYRLLEVCLRELGEDNQAALVHEEWQALERDDDRHGHDRPPRPSPPDKEN